MSEKRQIIRAETAGFCMGVDLALRKLDRLVSEGGQPVFTLGPIIHNPQVMSGYARQGVSVSDDIRQIPNQARVVIRAHGIPVDLEDSLLARGVKLVDATCPRVKRAQRLIQKHTAAGEHLLLLGEPDHPEVRGLLSYADQKAHVFEGLSDLRGLDLDTRNSYFLAAQTTQDRGEFNKIMEYLQGYLQTSLPVLDTICDATRQRQQEALAIAHQVELMVVVGGYNSGNTRRLAQVVDGVGVESIHIEQPGELPLEKLRSAGKIGLTAGASTPRSLIDVVYCKLLEIEGT
ncbi:MAG: 4-hydroxy-3-methylbut-2-enyl diphosphate reductase [Desulfohalobiaceae bacterium]|nr:4-hydroxy-3-methylbut-2-enyl diphosphate reductase [Desulfohalobiaceae bacterium]